MTDRDTGYTRHSVAVPAGTDRADVWRLLGAFDRQVAVNVIDTAGAPVLLSDDSLAALLEGASTSIVVETLPESRYRELALGKIDLALADAAALRAAWRTRPIADTATTLQTLLRRITEVALFASIFGRQRGDAGLVTSADRGVGLAQQLAMSTFQLDDTVRAMDDVHYELTPVLAALRQRMDDAPA